MQSSWVVEEFLQQILVFILYNNFYLLLLTFLLSVVKVSFFIYICRSKKWRGVVHWVPLQYPSLLSRIRIGGYCINATAPGHQHIVSHLSKLRWHAPIDGWEGWSRPFVTWWRTCATHSGSRGKWWLVVEMKQLSCGGGSSWRRQWGSSMQRRKQIREKGSNWQSAKGRLGICGKGGAMGTWVLPQLWWPPR